MTSSRLLLRPRLLYLFRRADWALYMFAIGDRVPCCVFKCYRDLCRGFTLPEKVNVPAVMSLLLSVILFGAAAESSSMPLVAGASPIPDLCWNLLALVAPVVGLTAIAYGFILN